MLRHTSLSIHGLPKIWSRGLASCDTKSKVPWGQQPLRSWASDPWSKVLDCIDLTSLDREKEKVWDRGGGLQRDRIGPHFVTTYARPTTAARQHCDIKKRRSSHAVSLSLHPFSSTFMVTMAHVLFLFFLIFLETYIRSGFILPLCVIFLFRLCIAQLPNRIKVIIFEVIFGPPKIARVCFGAFFYFYVYFPIISGFFIIFPYFFTV